ncbi:hypothetical protein [Nostoc sp.]
MAIRLQCRAQFRGSFDLYLAIPTLMPGLQPTTLMQSATDSTMCQRVKRSQ